MKEIQRQIKLPGVPKAKQGREVPPHWEWTEAAVWTERRLATRWDGKAKTSQNASKCLWLLATMHF